MSITRLLALFGLVFMLGACASVDKHVFDSTPHQPATLELMDTTNDTVFWKMDIPVWCRLKVNFDRSPEMELFKVNETFPRTRMTWTIHQKDDNTVIKKGVENLCGLPFMMKLSYRNPPEMPEVLPGNCLQLANVDLATAAGPGNAPLEDEPLEDLIWQQRNQASAQPGQVTPQPAAAPASTTPQNTALTVQPVPVQPAAQPQLQWQEVDQSAYRPYQPAPAQPTYQAAAPQRVAPVAAAASPLSRATTYQAPKQAAPAYQAPAPQWTAVPAAPVADFPAMAPPAAPAARAIPAAPAARINATPDFSMSAMASNSKPIQAAAGMRNLPVKIQSKLLTQYKLSSISILIEGVPSQATLSAGRNNGSGIWTLTGDQIKNLTMAVPVQVTQDVQLMIIATAPKPDGDTASTVTTVVVNIAAMARARIR